MKLYDLAWLHLGRHVRRTSSLQIILISVVLHSAASILLIYLHLRSFFQYELSNYEPKDLFSREGGVELANRRQRLNLLSSRVIDDSSDLGFGYRGWWSDGRKWNVEIACFSQKWILCTKFSDDLIYFPFFLLKVFTTKCKTDTMRSIYQFVPIHRGVLLQGLVISLRARADGLLEQVDHAVDPLFGIYVLVQHSGQHAESIRIEFPNDSSDWTKRSIRYSSPPGMHVTDVTVMLSCFGYSGVVSFADIEIIPEAENNNWMSPDSVAASCSKDATSPIKSLNQFRAYRHVNWSSEARDECSSSRLSNGITIGVHVSMDRISSLEKSLLFWNGLVSLSVFVTVANLTEGLSEWQRLYLDKKIKNMSMPKCSRVTLVLGQETGVTDYPINHLRNAVIGNVFSQFILLIDADFQVSPGLEVRFRETVDLNSVAMKAFVVPAFEWIETGQNEAVQSKAELIQLIFREDPLVQPFQSYDNPESHKLTNYFKWYYSSKSYPVRGFSDKFEPYFIVEKVMLPLFDERFSGHGTGKAAHTSETFAAGYSFFVLPSVWMIHHASHRRYDPGNRYSGDPHYQLRDAHLRFQFHLNLFKKYNMSESHCPTN